MKSFPCMPVKLKIVSPLFDLEILIVACPTLGFLLLAATAIPINAVVTIKTVLRNIFHAFSVHSKLFFILFSSPLRTSNLYWLGEKINWF